LNCVFSIHEVILEQNSTAEKKVRTSGTPTILIRSLQSHPFLAIFLLCPMPGEFKEASSFLAVQWFRDKPVP